MTTREAGSFAAHFCQSCAAGADIPDRDAIVLAVNAKAPPINERRKMGAIRNTFLLGVGSGTTNPAGPIASD